MEVTTKNRQHQVYSLKNFTVLLVDDYEFMQNLIGSMLKAFGVGGIMVCDNGQQAIELLKITHAQSRSSSIKGIDLILTDWMMPGSSGLELIRWVRNHPSDQIKFIPIVLLSAFASEDVVSVARDSGANEALVKPVSGEKMAARLLSVIDRPRPYIKAASFFGPDRRRRLHEYKGEERRIINPENLITHTERLS